MGEPVLADLEHVWTQMGTDERRVLLHLGQRLLFGQRAYSRIAAALVALDSAGDTAAIEVLAEMGDRMVAGNRVYGRLDEKDLDWRRNAAEEALDGFCYIARLLEKMRGAKR